MLINTEYFISTPVGALSFSTRFDDNGKIANQEHSGRWHRFLNKEFNYLLYFKVKGDRAHSIQLIIYLLFVNIFKPK